MKRVFLLCLSLLVLSVSLSYSQTKKITAGLSVSAPDSIKEEIESGLRRELRQLGDIDLYAKSPKYLIQVVAINPNAVIVMSVVVESKLDSTFLIESMVNETNMKTKDKKSMVDLFGSQRIVTQHFIQSDSSSNLDRLCKSVVASIDSKSFEGTRKSTDLFDDLAKRYLSKDTQPPSNDPKPRTTTKPVTSGDSPFSPEYVGGDKTVIRLKNDTDRILTLVFGGVTFTVAPKGERDIDIDGGRYEYSASVPRATPKSGVADFTKGYRWSWRFFIVLRRV